MDGMPMTSGSTLYQGDRASVGSVPIDAINEFTVETSGMKAEYGRAMGAVTFETKSGTNSVHGNLFENLRNNILDANGFFNNSLNRPRQVLKQHDFGATAGNDQTHMFRFAYTYDLPFGKGKHFNLGRAANTVAGDWTVSGFMTYESGTPIGVSDNFSPIGTGSRVFITSYEAWRAPIKGGKFDPAVDKWLDINQFNQGIPQTVLDTVFGNATRNNPKLRTPWSFDESLGIAKNIVFSEHVKLALRGEAFNLFNRVRWAIGNTSVSSANFGVVTSQANTPRRMQLAFRLVFWHGAASLVKENVCADGFF